MSYIKITKLFIISFFIVCLITSCHKEPVADFVADKNEVWSYENIKFTDLSTNSPSSWAWTFRYAKNDPSEIDKKSTEQNPTVYWNIDGKFDVNFTAKNKKGNGSTYKANYIKVNPNMVFWTDTLNVNDTIELFLSGAVPLDTSNFFIAFQLKGKINNASPDSNLVCSTETGFKLNASGTIFYFAYNRICSWWGSCTVMPGVCNNYKIPYKRLNTKISNKQKHIVHKNNYLYYKHL